MSNGRPPRPSFSMPMGTSGMCVSLLHATSWLRFRMSVSCNSMVARDITIDGDPDEVWEALNDPELLAEWLRRGGGGGARGGGAGARRGVRAERAARAVALRGRRAGLARRAAAGGGPGRHARDGHGGPGRAVRARGRVSPGPDVFAALADPTRRTVLQEVAERGTAT